MEQPNTLSDVPERYSRQARFPSVGPAGQARLAAARVAVVGCGALGSAAVDLLARGGVGEIVVIDRDVVELSNLQRQVLFDEADAAAGLPKAVAAARAVGRINSEIRVKPVVADLTPANVEELLHGAAVVLDGTDNFETRYLVNDACVKEGRPWIYGGAIGSTGMAMAILPGETPCFRCVHPDAQPAAGLATCETTGVLGAIVLVVAAVQWTEAVKLLVGDREHVGRGMAVFDLWSNEYLRIGGFPRRPDCPCCVARRFDYLDARATARTTTLCGRGAVQVSPPGDVRLDLRALGQRLASAGTVTFNEYVIRLVVGSHELTVFDDGRALVKGTDDPALARSLYARFVGA